MQRRKNVQELTAEIERQKKSSRDFVSPASKLEMVMTATPDRGNVPGLMVADAGVFPVGQYAGRHIAEKFKIPGRYYDRMRDEAPELLIDNVNTWMRRADTSHMVRTLDGGCRAFLSDAYRPIDNWVVAAGVLSQVKRSGLQIDIMSCEITERKMYIQLVTPEVTGTIRQGEVIMAGLTISNSEIGHGAATFENLVYFLACENGMRGSRSFRKTHVGGRLGNGADDVLVLSNATRQLSDGAFVSAMQDMTQSALSQLALDEEIKKITPAMDRELKASHAPDVVTEIKNTFNLSEAESEGVLDRFIESGDLSQFGLSSAVTNLANDQELVQDYDRVIELQKLGSDLVYMSGNDWDKISGKDN